MRKHICVILALLSAAVCAISARDLNGDFYTAIRNNNLQQLKGLISEKTDLNNKNSLGETPLMYAAAFGSADAMKLLITSGADVNLQTNSGATALIWSATDIAKVRLLLNAGADVKLATKRGRTALLVAAMSGNSADVVRLLISRGADVKATDLFKTSSLRAATLGNDTETIHTLVEAGVDVNAPDLAGITPLMMAAGWSGNLNAVKILLANGANVNAISRPIMGLPSRIGPSKFGNLSALLMAAPFGPPDLIQTLLDAGADVNAKDVRGMTPLMLAVATDHQNVAVISMLVKHGADPQIKSDLGETAADWAQRYGLPPGLQALDVLPEQQAAEPVHVTARSVALTPAVQRSVTLIEKSSWQFFAASGCVSCHAQSMTDFAVGVVRARGLQIDEKGIDDRARMLKAVYPTEPLLERMDPAGAMEQLAYPLVGLASVGYAPDRLTDAMVANIAAEQGANGSWHVGAAARPPGEEGDIFRTAICIRSLKSYAPPGRKPEMERRVAKAADWLRFQTAATAEDRSMKLLGLYWAGAKEPVLGNCSRDILAQQQSDGGWRPNDGLPSDPYATGEALYALAAAGGVLPHNPSYERGVRFLLSTQREDGSWYVPSRSARIQAYFEGGFPYNHDQWISSWATAWSAMALSEALDYKGTKKTLSSFVSDPQKSRPEMAAAH